MSLPERKTLQLERMKRSVNLAYEAVPFYKKSFEQAGFHPDQLKTLDDIKRIPFLTKQDMRDAYPFGLFAVPMEEVVRVHSSSGIPV